MLKMTFDHYFDYKFWSTKRFWVIFVSLASRHFGLQFEHKLCLIWIYIQWVMIVWKWANTIIKIKVLGSMRMLESRVCAHPRNLHTQARFQVIKKWFLAPEISILWWGPALKPLGTSVLMYKYSPYVSNQNPN